MFCACDFFFSFFLSSSCKVPQKPGTEIQVFSLEPGMPGMDENSLQDDLQYLADLAIPSQVLGFVSIP